MACPFLSRLPAKFVKNYTSPLVKIYADQCPIASRSMATMASKGQSSEPKDCPFLFESANKDSLVKIVDNDMSEDVMKFQSGKKIL